MTRMDFLWIDDQHKKETKISPAMNEEEKKHKLCLLEEEAVKDLYR